MKHHSDDKATNLSTADVGRRRMLQALGVASVAAVGLPGVASAQTLIVNVFVSTTFTKYRPLSVIVSVGETVVATRFDGVLHDGIRYHQ